VGTKSIQLNRAELLKLKEALRQRGIPIIQGNTPYELFRVNAQGYKCVAYTSGKLTYSSSYDLNNILNSRSTSRRPLSFDMYGGTDEAGKGEWYGPLVIAGALLTPDQIDLAIQIGVKDSKLLSPSRIHKIVHQITDARIDHKVLVIPPQKYNTLYQQLEKENKTLNDLLAWGHSKIIKQYFSKYRSRQVHLVVDVFNEEKLNQQLPSTPPQWLIEQRSQGERFTPVAVASVLARARFLTEVVLLEKCYKLHLSRGSPASIPKTQLLNVAKLHFSNVQKALHT